MRTFGRAGSWCERRQCRLTANVRRMEHRRLLIRLPIPEAGVYTISLGGSQRPLALSLDGGKTWRRFTQGTIARMVDLPAGHFECWFDDRYAAEEPKPARQRLSRLFSGQSPGAYPQQYVESRFRSR
ncbi:MAG: hypothetical protein ACOX6W_10950 [Lentisphaeria bacterium]